MPVVTHGQVGNSGSGPSPGVWGNCRVHLDPTSYIHYFEDFVNWETSTSDGVAPFFFADSSGTATVLATDVGGVVQIATDGTDNQGPVLTTGYNTAGFVKLTSRKSLWGEARIRLPQITAQDVFVGFAEEGLAADNGLFSDGDAIVDKDMIAFRILAADPDTFDAVYRTASGSGEVEAKGSAQDVTEDTFYKLGFHYDSEQDRLYWFVDGVKCSGQSVVHLSTAEVPDGEELAFYVGIKAAASEAKKIDVDWIKVAMER